MSKKKTIRFASRMDQLPPYLFGMIRGKRGFKAFAITSSESIT